MTWRRSAERERERKEMGWQSWGTATASAAAKDLVGWRAFLNGLGVLQGTMRNIQER